MDLQLKIAGCLMLLLALSHVAFPKYFRWKKDFAAVSLVNRQMMYIHTFFIALLLLLIGLLCLTSADDLLHTRLGHRIALGLGIFWGIRLVLQFWGYSAVHWRRKGFETFVHILFVVLWTYLSVVFLKVIY
jgi:hypothetical protein